MKFPARVELADITIRDGFQHEEKWIPTQAKLWIAEELILAGYRRIEVTNLGNPKGMPQFGDADDVIKGIRASKRLAGIAADVELTAITIRERAVDRAIALTEQGFGPDRILMMVSTSASHMKKNSGLDHAAYWAEAERSIRKAHDAGIRVNGTVSTIWGCPIEGPTRLEDAVAFTKRFLEIGADDIEHADHDGSAHTLIRDKYQEKIDAAFDDVARQIGFVVTTTIPVDVEVGRDRKVKKVSVSAPNLKGTLFEKITSTIGSDALPGKVAANTYRIYLIWYKALKLRLRTDFMEPAHFRPEVREPAHYRWDVQEPAHFRWGVQEPAHWFDPGFAIAAEEAVVIHAIDEVYPELKLAERVSAQRQLARGFGPGVREPAHFRPEVREPAHPRPEVLEPVHTTPRPEFLAELQALLRKYGL